MARAEEADIVHFDRPTFLTQVWDYEPGECVTVLSPFGGGKTVLSYQLLSMSATQECPAVVMVMKPRDKEVANWTKKLDLQRIYDWPPPKLRVFQEKPRGWTLWPRHTYDPAIDEPRHRAIFRRAILDCYKRGNRIIFADETYSLEEELGLTTELRTVWTKGRSQPCGLWAASQRPVNISRWAYQAQHLFLGNDTDEDTQRRLSEIGGAVNPGQVRWILPRLRPYEFLYINRQQRAMCVVGA